LPLSSGARLGPYEIVAAVGDAINETYKAADTEQKRTVVLKILPPSLTGDAERRARLERYARTLSAMTSEVISWSAVEMTSEAWIAVSPFFEGVTLADRLKKGPLPLDEAVGAAIAIADALNAANRSDVIHGNLKPTNIMFTPDGVKLLDFGLARWEQPAAVPASSSDKRAKATLPDVPDDIVRYLAPERIEGQAADARSDIFGFGAVVYEMITGTKAFEGRNRPMLVAAIGTLDPYPLSKTQPDSPPMLDHIVQRCLAKDPDDRWQTAHDLLVQLRWVAEGGDVLLARARQKRERRTVAVLATATFLVTVLVGVAFSWRGSGETESFQFRVPVTGLSTADIAISPDGKLLAFVARPNTADASSLYVRPTGSTAFTRLVGTDDAAQPFWSPNSRSIGFAAAGRLKTVDATGGAPKDLGPAPGFTGGTWGTNQIILFGSAKGLVRVSAQGGQTEAATTIDKDEAGHYWPSFLPDGQRYMYLSWSATPANRAVYVGSLASKDKTKLMSADSNATYAAPGFVVFHREATLFAQAFDAGTLKLSGDPLHIADQVEFSPSNGHGSFDVGGQGALVYFQGQGGRGGAAGRGNMVNSVQFGWRDRTGKALALAGENNATVGDIDLSPDGRQIAITLPDPASAGADIYVIDWQRAGVAARLSLDPGDDINPVFSRPTGDKVAFTTYRKGNADIYIRNTNGTGDETPLLATPADESIEAWSNDGRYIAYKLGHDGTEDIWVLPLFGDKKPFPMVEGPFHKDEPQFSYDGKWLAYASDEANGKFQVFVTSFPDRGQKILISKDGGGQPRWRENGKELFFRSPDNGVMAADILTVPKLDAHVPHLLFTGMNSGSGRDPVRHMWAVTPDGERFLLKVPAGAASAGGSTPLVQFGATLGAPTAGPPVQQAVVSSGLTVIRNWPALFKKGAQ